MEIKPLFRDTQYGIFPQEWDYLPFGDIISELRGGASLTPKDFSNTGISVLPKSGVTRGGILKIEPKNLQFCTSDFANNNKGSLVDKNFSIIVLRDLVPSGPNIGLIVSIKDDFNYIIAQGVYAFKVIVNKVLPEYLNQLSNSDEYRKLMQSILVGSTQVHIRSSVLKATSIPIPNLKEQTSIATALSDADALITGLEKLIAKKRNIKQGAMQQLLKPKEGWEVKTLGECAFITKLAGFEYSLHFNSYKDEGEIIVIRGTNITNNKLDLRDIKTIPTITSKKLPRSKLSKNDLVFAYVGTIGPIYLVEENDRFHLGPNTSKITVNKDVDSKYVYHYFTSENIKKEITEHTSIGAQPSLSMSKIRSFNIPIPNLEEQIRIATILSDMDAELTALEQKLEKYKKVKLGMMQELLTGKTRLV